MESFSQKYGYKSLKTVMQVETMDSDLRNGLWNALCLYYWDDIRTNQIPHADIKMRRLLQRIWLDYFKKPIDSMLEIWEIVRMELRNYYFGCEWNEVYDFIQFVPNNYDGNIENGKFIDYCNEILKREMSGYRFVGTTITPITSGEEIAEIEEALQVPKALEPVAIHLKSALDKFSDRQSPDYRNSIKESISAVEAICRLIAGSGATLGKAIGEIRRQGKVDLHGALEDAFDKLYGYTSDEGGIRHSLLEEPDLDFEDAKFMLISCSAFVNYLKVKIDKAGIKLEIR